MSPSKVSTVDFTTFHNIVDGKQRGSDSNHHGIDPATGQELWAVPIATQQDVDDAVKAATKAFKSWSQVPMEKRKESLRKYADLCASYESELTELLYKENGKPKMFANQEVQGIGAWINHHVSLELPEDKVETPDAVVTTRFKPLGVCAGICPWNFPIVLSIGKICPAVMTGNCIIIKPSPFTPYTALKLVELAQEIFPPGVIQVLGGNDKLGPMLTAHPDIAKVSFTGSIATGKKIMQACAGTLKRVTLELGGNDATIVLPDVDIEKCAPEVAMGAFFNSGQVCVATKRIYVHESIYKPFLAKMVEFTKSLKVGPADQEGVIMGPIQNSMQYEKVKGFFEDSKKNNYTFAHGKPEVEAGKGYFIQPTIIDNPPEDSRIVQEEPFGPIVPLMPYSDIEDAIAKANNTNTGLGACVYGHDVAEAEKVGLRLDAGSVFINSFEKPGPHAYFGGVKESGIGGEWGKLGMLAYCNPHVMHVMKAGAA